MHSSLVRIQNVFGFFTTVAFSVMGVIALSVLFHPQTPSASLSMTDISVVKGRPHYYSTVKEEYAHIKFSLETDLTSLFSWNTKQIFLYIVATFPPSSSSAASSIPYSEAVVWDAIVPSPLAPWHENTYIHPLTTRSPKQSRDRVRQRKEIPKDKQSKRLRTHDPQLDEALPHPKGAQVGIVRLEGQKPKYQVTTPTGRIGGLANCSLELRYNVQPWVGALTWGGGKGWRGIGPKSPLWQDVEGARSRAFKMPDVREKGSATKKEDLGTEAGAEARRGKPS